MAHAISKPGTASGTTGATTGAAGPGGTPRTPLPDVLSPLAHRVARWAVPLGIGLVYGYWAASMRRRGGPITGENVLFGFLTVIAFVVLLIATRALAERLPREGHAILRAAFAGAAIGFLYSQSNPPLFTCILISVLSAGAIWAILFYYYYTHEDAEGNRLP
ncbi:hypothetical protein ACGFZL_04465 [Streptomyces sp. NPDC048182]|uniref:hypothetical protein n=1 Tax=Streptomyces sp. NPDC048182 TaxID=3365507 RepID=UPI00370FC288